MIFSADDAAALDQLLRWRRDVRLFKPEPLDEAVIARLQSAMELAPSVGNSRPWRVIRADSEGLRAAVRAQFETSNAEATATYQGRQRDDYRALVLAGLATAPLQLAVFTVPDPDEGHRLGRATMPETLAQSTAMAIHTLWLAARVRNIGLGTVSILDPAAIERLCAVPAEWRFSAWLCLGHAASDDDLPLLHRAGWQENTGCGWESR